MLTPKELSFQRYFFEGKVCLICKVTFKLSKGFINYHQDPSLLSYNYNFLSQLNLSKEGGSLVDIWILNV